MSSEEQEPNLTKGQKAYLRRIINEVKKDANSIIESLNLSKNEYDKYLKKVQETFNNLTDIVEDANTKNNDLNELYNEIFVPDGPGQKSLKENITNFKSEFEKLKSEILNIKSDINSYSDEIFSENGIMNKIDVLVDDFDKLYSSQKEKQNSLFEEIEGLLKGASTVALAGAFKEHKDSFKTLNTIWAIILGLSLTSLMGLSIFIYFHSDFHINEMWKGTVGNIPFIVGAVWLAIYSSKQRSQNKRLQQEYAFKEDVAKVYYGLKKEIEQIDDTELGEEMKNKIMDIIIESVAYNPSITLESNSHNDKGPIQDAIEKATDLIRGKGAGD